MWFVAGLVVCGLGLLLARWATDTRQSAVRSLKHAQLQSIAQASRIYDQDSGTPATLDALLGAGLIVPEIRNEFSRAVPATSTSTVAGLAPIVVQTIPCRAVCKGEAWGGPGETTDVDLPACRFVLMSDWSVAKIEESEFQREWAERLRLVPLK